MRLADVKTEAEALRALGNGSDLALYRRDRTVGDIYYDRRDVLIIEAKDDASRPLYYVVCKNSEVAATIATATHQTVPLNSVPCLFLRGSHEQAKATLQ